MTKSEVAKLIRSLKLSNVVELQKLADKYQKVREECDSHSRRRQPREGGGGEWAILLLAASRTRPRLRTSLWKADAAQEVLKARVSAKGIQLGVGGDPGRAVRALVEGFSQP
jgi:hypothetical protein